MNKQKCTQVERKRFTPFTGLVKTLLLLSLAFGVNSCKKELLLSKDKLQSNLTLKEAREYFESNLKQMEISRKANPINGKKSTGVNIQDILYNKQPIWDKAYEKLISTGMAVKIPIDFGNIRKIVDEKTKAFVPYSSLNYLLMYKDSLQQIRAEWVYLKPTLNWLNGNRTIFEGSITIKDWNGNILRSYSYGNSQITSNKNTTLNKSNMGGGGNQMPLQDGCLIWAVQEKCTCPRAWSSGTHHVGSWNPDKCDYCDLCIDYYCMPEPECESCPPPPDWGGGTGGSGGNSGGTGNNPGGNGGSGGGTNPNDYTPTNCNPDPNYVDPHITYPDGSTSVPACSDIPLPQYPPAEPGVIARQRLISNLGITDAGEINYLTTYPSMAINLYNHMGAVSWTEDNIEIGKWAVSYLTQNPSLTWPEFMFPTIYDDAVAADEELIDNGIEIEDIPSSAPTGPIRTIATTVNRGNTEDMTWGTNGNASRIVPSVLTWSDSQLFDKMTSLFHTFSILNLETVSDDFIARFQNKTGGSYEHPMLNNEVKYSATFINFAKKFGALLNSELRAKSGVIANVSPFQVERPVFGGTTNLATGLQILIHDTEYSEIKLLNYNINSLNEWYADIEVTIHDHFGVDENDAVTYQRKFLGFAAWWVLQHKRAYKPFETIIKVKTRINGKL